MVFAHVVLKTGRDLWLCIHITGCFFHGRTSDGPIAGAALGVRTLANTGSRLITSHLATDCRDVHEIAGRTGAPLNYAQVLVRTILSVFWLLLNMHDRASIKLR